MSTSIQTSSPTVLPDPENMGLAVGISLLSCAQAEIQKLQVSRPPSWIFHFRFLSLRSYIVTTSLVGYFDPPKHGYIRWNCVACLQAKIEVFHA